MTKRERLLAAFHNQPVDRIPMGFWFHFSSEDLGKKTIEQHLQFYRDAQLDMIKVMCDGFFDYPNPYAKKVTKPEEWFGMEPMPEDAPFFTKQVERAKGIVEGVKGECCVFYNVFCPMSLMRFGIGWDMLMAHIRENPDAMRHAFHVAAQDQKTLVRRLIGEAGCDGIYYCVQNAEEFRFTAEEYRSLVTPSDLEVLEYANTLSDCNILHCCGWDGNKNRVEVWKDYPAKVVNWAVYVEQMSLTEGKEFFGCDCVLGGFDNRKQGVLYSGSREEIEKEAERVIAQYGKTGIVAGADCTLPADIDISRLRWLREKLDQLS